MERATRRRSYLPTTNPTTIRRSSARPTKSRSKKTLRQKSYARPKNRRIDRRPRNLLLRRNLPNGHRRILRRRFYPLHTLLGKTRDGAFIQKNQAANRLLP